MRMPAARGPLSAAAITLLTSPRDADLGLDPAFRDGTDAVADPLTDGDLQLALALLNELHHHSIDGVDDAWEWHPAVVLMRNRLESAFESALREVVPEPSLDGDAIWQRLRALVAADGSPSVGRHLARRGTRTQLREFLMQRSVYHLREADSHTWGIPRLQGRAKAALVEIQRDEYGDGRPERMHAALFAATLRAAGLDDEYGAYWDQATAQTFAAANVITLFGMHRRLRGALCGHLAAFEMTSTGPNRDYARAVRRAGMPKQAAAFFDEHVEADAVHEQIAAVDLCGGLVASEPQLAGQILWGAAVGLLLDGAAGAALLQRWGVAAAEEAA